MLTNFTFSFREEEFQGLKFKSDLDFPAGHFDSLLEEGSHYSEIKYADDMDSQTLQSIHIKLSYALVLKIISIMFMITAIILYFVKLTVSSVILISTGAVLLVINIYLTHKSNELYALRDATRTMVKLLFENKD